MCRAAVQETRWYEEALERRASSGRRRWRGPRWEKLRASQRRVAGAVHHGWRAVLARLLAVLGLLGVR